MSAVAAVGALTFAAADTGRWHTFSLKTPGGGATFEGKYKFNPRGTGHGGFVVSGRICDEVVPPVGHRRSEVSRSMWDSFSGLRTA
ncbi:hypothetical protein NLX83_35785 [Allokutzneria sp. A3M-2-11 16]|uniref:hypothetical protein n=1 Tax=Allokutzneria sp. A3M-2-11 16 TaxID=2962043 RepID=UPI0020B67FF3|nr:hypothetical protein [Allokutzneria sp. A3M-2-11 16]MCP3804646.1 hypothetical protein [Allokutzneria sp. A3M-2-11 16]